jgi:hypothetical protein
VVGVVMIVDTVDREFDYDINMEYEKFGLKLIHFFDYFLSF